MARSRLVITYALTSQVIGWLLITMSLTRLPAALTSLLLIIQPVSAVALAAVILNESPNMLQLIGVVIVVAALVMATRRLPKRIDSVRRAAPSVATPSGKWVRRQSISATSSDEPSG